MTCSLCSLQIGDNIDIFEHFPGLDSNPTVRSNKLDFILHCFLSLINYKATTDDNIGYFSSVM